VPESKQSRWLATSWTQWKVDKSRADTTNATSKPLTKQSTESPSLHLLFC